VICVAHVSRPSSQKFFIEIANTTVDVVYTGVPILVLATLDQDVSAKTTLRFPFLYTAGIKRERLTTRIFWYGAWQGGCLCPPICCFCAPLRCATLEGSTGRGVPSERVGLHLHLHTCTLTHPFFPLLLPSALSESECGQVFPCWSECSVLCLLHCLRVSGPGSCRLTWMPSFSSL
jgi:hypothetical protein